jgi:hypothetical protein
VWIWCSGRLDRLGATGIRQDLILVPHGQQEKVQVQGKVKGKAKERRGKMSWWSEWMSGYRIRVGMKRG